jgi:hypothetical protein
VKREASAERLFNTFAKEDQEAATAWLSEFYPDIDVNAAKK